MLIQSNFKDYYDYLQGVYGVDEKIIYERTCYSQIDVKGNWSKSGLYKPEYMIEVDVRLSHKMHQESLDAKNYEFAMLAICGTVYCVYIINKKFYFGLNYEDYKEKKYDHITKTLSKNNISRLVSDLPRKGHRFDFAKSYATTTDLNVKENCPVLLIKEKSHYHSDEVIAKNVRLSDFGIGQIISPHDMYINISNFLSREKPVEDTRTDVQKIVGRGFDKKTSFRKAKKN